eukprot:TRINITY_DN2919_c6_g1_i1.p1 TRINITY_DN2919_c6_g1~~TRINITY_DN2919_c6_g1_i1.p1  ORF type:complete len:305 (-),score=83.29 TRINITY_DN2919_c6_g1_i1:149-1063(-)
MAEYIPPKVIGKVIWRDSNDYSKEEVYIYSDLALSVMPGAKIEKNLLYGWDVTVKDFKNMIIQQLQYKALSLYSSNSDLPTINPDEYCIYFKGRELFEYKTLGDYSLYTYFSVEEDEDDINNNNNNNNNKISKRKKLKKKTSEAKEKIKNSIKEEGEEDDDGDYIDLKFKDTVYSSFTSMLEVELNPMAKRDLKKDLIVEDRVLDNRSHDLINLNVNRECEILHFSDNTIAMIQIRRYSSYWHSRPYKNFNFIYQPDQIKDILIDKSNNQLTIIGDKKWKLQCISSFHCEWLYDMLTVKNIEQI